MGGKQVGDVEVGYGPARGFRAAEVRAIASALATVTPEQLALRFNPKAMTAADIYPSIWDRLPEEKENRSYLVDYYDQLRAFMAGAAQNDEALLVYLT